MSVLKFSRLEARHVGWGQIAGGLLFAVGSLVFPPAHVPANIGLAVLYLGVASVTAWPVWRAVRSGRLPASTRPAWLWLTGAALVWFLADVAWKVRELGGGEAPVFSLEDVGYLAFYPLALQALASFPGWGSSRHEQWRIQLDALLAALTVGVVLFWIWPLTTSPDIPFAWIVQVVHVANPTGDLMLLTAVAVLRARHTSLPTVRLLRSLMLALAIKALADTLHAGVVIGNLAMLDGLSGALWLSFFGIISLCTEHADRSIEHSGGVPQTLNLRWLPYASVILTGGLLLQSAFAGKPEVTRIMALGTVALSVSVLLRQALVGAENRRLDRLATEGAAESRLAALVRHSHDIVVVVDAEGVVGYASPSVEGILSHDPRGMVGLSGFDMIHADDVDGMKHVLAQVLHHPDRSQAMVTRARHGDGSWREMEIIATNRLATPSIHGIVLNLRDVTERRELEGKLEWQAFHDPMTGLANRVLFTDRVKHALTRRQRSPHDIGVLFIDLDNFKVVNDTLGHHAGDTLLREAARRIASEVRGADTVARLGGDEFAVLLEDASREQCQQTAERLLAQLTKAFMVEGREVFTGGSVGLTMADVGVTYEELVRDADVAMYVAKAEGRGRVVAFHESMRVEMTERLLLEADLRKALEHEELSVHYQPQIDLQSGEILGAEALVRWTHPTRGVIPPSRFVPIAEQAGLMVALSRFVLRTATRDAAEWRLPGHVAPALHVAVNLSGRHVQDASLLQDVQEALTTAQLDPSLVTLEITESVMMHNTQSAMAVLQQLKALGIKVAIDDFGTGYSSLSYLQQFPIDVLKIDKRFIDTLGTGTGDDALTRAILSLGDALGLATVAEGIETPRQLAELQAMGCLLGQGYLLSHPLPARQFAEQLRTGNLQKNLEQMTFATDARRVA